MVYILHALAIYFHYHLFRTNNNH